MEKKFIEPLKIKADTSTVLLNGMRPKVDIRVISEGGYQTLKRAYDKLNEIHRTLNIQPEIHKCCECCISFDAKTQTCDETCINFSAFVRIEEERLGALGLQHLENILYRETTLYARQSLLYKWLNEKNLSLLGFNQLNKRCNEESLKRDMERQCK